MVEWEKNCHKVKAGVVSLRIDLEKSKAKLDLVHKFTKGTKTLNGILNVQRSLAYKEGLVYTYPQQTLKQVANTRFIGSVGIQSYAKVLQGEASGDKQKIDQGRNRKSNKSIKNENIP